MKIIIQTENSAVIVNGVSVEGVDLSDLPADVWLIWWNSATGAGEVEYRCRVEPGRREKKNKQLSSFAPYQKYLDRRRAVIETMRRDHDAAVDAMGHDGFRRLEYPPVNELVVALWEHVVEGRSLADAGATALETRRQAVKAAYPTGRPPTEYRGTFKGRVGDDLDFRDPDA